MRNTRTYCVISTPVLTLLALLLVGATNIKAAPGDLDTTFGNGGIVISTGGSINTLEAALGMALQADGKIVAVGYGAGGGTNWDSVIARYNTDGSPDTSFGGGGVVVTPLSNCSDFALSVAIQADGKIVVAGFATNSVQNCDSGAGYNFAVVRYHPNGSLDTTFNGTGKVITPINSENAIARSVAIQADGKIVVAGDSWGSSGGGPRLVRFNTNGSLDTSFDNDGIVTTGVGGFAVAIQADDKIVAAGGGVSRYNADGSLDTTFNGTGIVATPDRGAYSVAIQADGKILTVSGTSASGADRLVRYNANGTPDTSFNGTGSVAIPIFVNSAAIQANGKIVAAGLTEFGEGAAFAVIRLNGNGSLDATFGGTGTVITPIVTEVYYSSGANGVAIQPDGKIVAAGGVVDRFFDLFDFALVRYQGDSVLPPSCPNPIDCAEFFVRQHYLDFLSREPEQAGFQEWMSVLNSCNGDLSCLYGPDGKRTLVSLSFFGSQEFNLKGGYVFRFYKATLGRMPTYVEMDEAMRNVTGATADEVFQKRATFAAKWVVRNDFLDAFPRVMSPADFVDKIEATAGITLGNRNQIINDLTVANNTDAARAVALRAIVDSNEEQNKELNASFVYMQYVGYLRRDPDPNGYNSWLTYLNDHPGDFKTMVWGFVDSIEYRKRFGQP